MLIDSITGEATPILSAQAADDRARVPGEVLLVRTDDQQQGAIDRQSTPLQPQQTLNPPGGVLRPILPPLDTVLENEIWQYRYPPFDTLFNHPADEESPDSSESESAGGVRPARFDSLPSYVIGILDPAELVDGLFHQRPFDSSSNTGGAFRSVDVLRNRNSVPVSESDGDVVESNEFTDSFKSQGVRRDSKANLEAQSPNKVFGVPKIILEADDRWVWRSLQ